jgi:hypothetical protein
MSKELHIYGSYINLRKFVSGKWKLLFTGKRCDLATDPVIILLR